ncbi:MAG: tyrosine-type recombinase/integrase [Mesorhizobium sp.]
MPTLKLTDKGIRALPTPQHGQVDYFDTLLPSFGVRLSKGGTASFFVTSRIAGGDGKLVRFTVGRWSRNKQEGSGDQGMTLGEARDSARLLMDQARRGVDPRKVRAGEIAESQRKAVNTFGKVADDFLATYAVRRLRPASIRAYRAALEQSAVEWREKPISAISRRDAFKLVDGIEARGRVVLADRTHAYLRKFFNWAVSRDYLDASPFDGIRRDVHAVSRDRTLSDDEIRLFWSATDKLGWPFGPMFKLLLLTGQRRAEVAGMRWGELTMSANEPGWLIPRERAKNNRTHWVPLAPECIAILDTLPKVKNDTGVSDLVFTTTGETPVSGFSRAKGQVDTGMLALAVEDDPEASIPGWTLHDLRRTAATGMAGLGFPVHVVEAVLNHKSGTISGVAAIYNRHDYAAEKRAALEAWANAIEAVNA